MSGPSDNAAPGEAAPEIMPAEWHVLALHYRRDALFIVDRRLSLADAAAAVGSDDAERVKTWIQSGWLARPTPEQATHWASKEGPRFLSAIVQPFVLAQPLDQLHEPSS